MQVLMGLIGKIAKGTGIGILTLAVVLYVTGYTIFIVNDIKTNRKLKEVKYELNTDRDEKLSESEVKAFFDKTGISPYTKKSLEKLSLEELERFNLQYEKQ